MGRSAFLDALNRLEIEDGRIPSQVEQVFARAAVPGEWALFLREVSEAMLNDNTLAEVRATGGGRDLLSQLLLERLVFCDADLASVVEGTAGAGGALRT